MARSHKTKQKRHKEAPSLAPGISGLNKRWHFSSTALQFQRIGGHHPFENIIRGPCEERIGSRILSSLVPSYHFHPLQLSQVGGQERPARQIPGCQTLRPSPPPSLRRSAQHQAAAGCGCAATACVTVGTWCGAVAATYQVLTPTDIRYSKLSQHLLSDTDLQQCRTPSGIRMCEQRAESERYAGTAQPWL
ncbi:uncharacterized protein LOC144322820 [Canis aureus]